MNTQGIKCAICGAEGNIHAIRYHLRDQHAGWEGATTDVQLEEAYKRVYPTHPIYSELALSRLQEATRQQQAQAQAQQAQQATAAAEAEQPFLHSIFGLGNAPEARTQMGNPIPVRVLNPDDAGSYKHMIPAKDEDYVFNIDLLKTVLFALELNIPVWLWGHSGVGKTTLLEQVAHHTNRPFVRVQHTINTERAQIVGQTLANENGTYYEPGPLALAVKHGHLYVADEYDAAHPTVTMLYQAVLEGKPLVIEDAPEEWRHVVPHPDFRICATGNTNGSGDESGLYNGTHVMNSANIERFGIVKQVTYMKEAQEVALLQKKVGLVQADAARLVKFANDIRKAYDESVLSAPISTRSLIFAGKIGKSRGSWTLALEETFTNRLPKTDAQAAIEVMNRHFSV